MEIILVAIAIAVMFFMYRSLKEYLANPKSYGSLKSQDDEDYKDYKNPYATFNQEEKITHSEYGIIIALLAKVAQSDTRVCELEVRLVDELINDMLEIFQDHPQAKDILQRHFQAEQSSMDNVEDLAIAFVRLTKGEYKKRLKVVEFLLMLAYADGTLDAREREIILDIAAYFELSNEDFNRVYDNFAHASQQSSPQLSRQEALEILGITEEELTEQKLKETYRQLVKQHHPDIIQGRGAQQKDILQANAKLAQINEAYELLKKERNS